MSSYTESRRKVNRLRAVAAALLGVASAVDARAHYADGDRRAGHISVVAVVLSAWTVGLRLMRRPPREPITVLRGRLNS